MFLDFLLTKIPEDDVSKQQLNDIINNAVKEYHPGVEDQMLANIKDELLHAEEELSVLYSKQKTIMSKAK